MTPLAVFTPITRTWINYMSMANRGRDDACCLGIAKVLADYFPLPAGAVEDINAYFSANVQIPMTSKLSELNELLLIDNDTIVDLAKRLYVTRYNIAYPSRSILFLTKPTPESVGTVGLKFFGLDKAISPEIQSKIEKAPEELANTVNGFNRFLVELDEFKSKSGQ